MLSVYIITNQMRD